MTPATAKALSKDITGRVVIKMGTAKTQGCRPADCYTETPEIDLTETTNLTFFSPAALKSYSLGNLKILVSGEKMWLMVSSGSSPTFAVTSHSPKPHGFVDLTSILPLPFDALKFACPFCWEMTGARTVKIQSPHLSVTNFFCCQGLGIPKYLFVTHRDSPCWRITCGHMHWNQTLNASLH